MKYKIGDIVVISPQSGKRPGETGVIEEIDSGPRWPFKIRFRDFGIKWYGLGEFELDKNQIVRSVLNDL